MHGYAFRINIYYPYIYIWQCLDVSRTGLNDAERGRSRTALVSQEQNDKPYETLRASKPESAAIETAAVTRRFSCRSKITYTLSTEFHGRSRAGRATNRRRPTFERGTYLMRARWFTRVYTRVKNKLKKKKRQKWGGKTTKNSNVTLVTRTRTDKPRRPCERHYNFNRLRRTHFIRNNIYFVP